MIWEIEYTEVFESWWKHLAKFGIDRLKNMTKPYENLRNKIPSEQRTRIDRKARKILRQMSLNDIRLLRRCSQIELADLLEIRQASVSKLERRSDIHVSSLRKFIEALGGELVIQAEFPEGVVRIRDIGGLKN
jgi:predicted XRE-type DNA-binding protein